MLRYFRVWLLFMKTAVIREMEFRGSFFAWMIINLAWMGFTVSFFWVIYGHTDTIGGWDANQLMVLLGTFFCMEFFVWTFGYPNLGRISTYVNKGELDFFLLKPINPQFHVSLRRFSPHNTASLVPAAGMLLIGLRGMGLTLSLGKCFCTRFSLSPGCSFFTPYGSCPSRSSTGRRAPTISRSFSSPCCKCSGCRRRSLARRGDS